MTKSPTQTKPLTLADIRKAQADVDKQRLLPDLPSEDRELLDLSAVALRQAERQAITKLQKEIVQEMETATVPLNTLAKEIRERIKRINKVPKFLDATEKILKQVLQILLGVGKWF